MEVERALQDSGVKCFLSLGGTIGGRRGEEDPSKASGSE